MITDTFILLRRHTRMLQRPTQFEPVALSLKSLGRRVNLTACLHLVPRLGWVKLYLPSAIHVHGVYRDGFTKNYQFLSCLSFRLVDGCRPISCVYRRVPKYDVARILEYIVYRTVLTRESLTEKIVNSHRQKCRFPHPERFLGFVVCPLRSHETPFQSLVEGALVHHPSTYAQDSFTHAWPRWF